MFNYNNQSSLCLYQINQVESRYNQITELSNKMYMNKGSIVLITVRTNHAVHFLQLRWKNP
jgi:hypothetical protein